LIAKGWPQGTLRIAVVRTEFGQRHLVLVVRSNDGDIVLDNLSPKIQAWNLVNHEWISMQSAEKP
jgi:predicted transglutaminase-like cysteine proteinase